MSVAEICDVGMVVKQVVTVGYWSLYSGGHTHAGFAAAVAAEVFGGGGSQMVFCYCMVR